MQNNQLVGGFNPVENLPRIGMNIKHIWNHHLANNSTPSNLEPLNLIENKARHKICYFLNSPRLVGLHL